MLRNEESAASPSSEPGGSVAIAIDAFMKPDEFTNPVRVADLVSELTDGNRSPEVVEELGRLLVTDPAALEWYCEWMTVHTLLHLEFAVGQQTLTTSSTTMLEG